MKQCYANKCTSPAVDNGLCEPHSRVLARVLRDPPEDYEEDSRLTELEAELGEARDDVQMFSGELVSAHNKLRMLRAALTNIATHCEYMSSPCWACGIARAALDVTGGNK